MENIQTLRSVSDTLLIPLYCRARESKSVNPIINDKIAEDIYESVKLELINSPKKIHQKLVKNKYNKLLVATLALRARKFDSYVCGFLFDNPDGIVVSLGSGLDTRFFRIDNGEVQWYDIDFPNVIALREKFVPQNPRCHNIASSVLDFDWMDKIDKSKKVMFIAEGLFMYLKEEDVKELFLRLQKHFPGSELVCEMSNKYVVDKMGSRYFKYKFHNQMGFEEDSFFKFGIKGENDIEKWSDGIKFIDEWSYFDDKNNKLGWMNIMGKIPIFRKTQWTLRFRLG